MAETDFAKADRLTKRRARVTTVMGVFFIATQTASLGPDIALSRPQTMQLSAWMIWSVALLMLLATGGGWMRSKNVRALMNDEGTLEHRSRAMVMGFWIAIGTAILVYAFSFLEPIGAKAAMRLILTATIGGALLRFGALERRSLI